MKGGGGPRLCRGFMVLVVAGLFMGVLSAAPSYAQPRAERLGNARQHPVKRGRPARPASEPARTTVPSDLDQRHRDGHMTPDERRLLRQHIEEAVRDLYKR